MSEKLKLERRVYEFEVRAEQGENGKTIVGRPIVYDRMTDIGPYEEVIVNGALTMADLTDVRFLVNHNTKSIPLARSRRNNGNSTMQLTVDEQGMLINVNLDVDNNSEARALYSAVMRGDISGMSFMFSVRRDEWVNIDSEHPTRRILEIASVVEVSAVTFPAYTDTDIQARNAETLENAKRALENAKRQSLESDKNEIELLKQKISILGG